MGMRQWVTATLAIAAVCLLGTLWRMPTVASPVPRTRRPKVTPVIAADTADSASGDETVAVLAATKRPNKMATAPAETEAVDDASRESATPATANDEADATAPATKKARRPKHPAPTRKGGRDGVDHSHLGLTASAEGVNHAWPKLENACHGAHPLPSCVANKSLAWFKKHVLLAIVTGREDTFRVEVSQCTWLAHAPPDNVYVVTDVAPSVPRTPHHWVAATLPKDIEERDGDLFSPYVKKGYVRAVRSAGQGYSASWIVAQFRFPFALQLMAKRFDEDPSLKWALLADDDTIVNFDNLVQRVSKMDEGMPWYLSRKGWGGAGHLYSRAAMARVHAQMHECVDKWMIRQFRASDTMLLKCASHLKLKAHLEGTMSHCPASHLRERIADKQLMTLHAKKDMYPPVLLATWRMALYYHAALCHTPGAKDLAVEFSACAYGSCKSNGCDKEADRRRMVKWVRMSKNGTLARLPLEKLPPPQDD